MLARSSCEGHPHKDGSPEAALDGGLPCGEPPGPALDVTARADNNALARRVLGNGHEHVHEMPTLTLPSPFQGEGLHPLVRVHVAVPVPVRSRPFPSVPVRRLPFASSRPTTARFP